MAEVNKIWSNIFSKQQKIGMLKEIHSWTTKKQPVDHHEVQSYPGKSKATRLWAPTAKANQLTTVHLIRLTINEIPSTQSCRWGHLRIPTVTEKSQRMTLHRGPRKRRTCESLRVLMVQDALGPVLSLQNPNRPYDTTTAHTRPLQ